MSKQVFYLDADHLEDRGLMSQSPPPEMTGMGKEWEDSCFKAHFHFSVQAEVFIRKERGTEQRYQGRGLKSSLRAGEHNLFQ